MERDDGENVRHSAGGQARACTRWCAAPPRSNSCAVAMTPHSVAQWRPYQALPQPQSHPPIGSAVSRKVF